MARVTWIPEIASWASGRHQPPVVSAWRANVTLPPRSGFTLVSFVLTEVVPVLGFGPPLGLLLPQAAISITMTSARAIAPPALRLRDPRTYSTFPPNDYEPVLRPAERVTSVTVVTMDRIGAT